MATVVKIGTGLGGTPANMPLVGLGVWKAGKDTTESVVFEALKAGWRHIDGACDYGNEVEVGRGIRKAIEQGIVKREDLFITTKLWNTYHRKEHVLPACRRSLEDMGLDYIDLYLVHFPIALKFVPFEKRYPPEWVHDPDTENKMVLDAVPYRETWEAMEELKATGLVKNIGVSNLTCSALMDILTYCKVQPAVNQVEMHPHLTQSQLVSFCQEKGIQLTAFSPLGATGYVDMGMATSDDVVLESSVVKGLAEKYKRTPAQVCLRLQTQRGIVCVPKTVRVERLKENLACCDFDMEQADIDSLLALNRNRRYNDPGVFTKGMGMTNGYPIYG